MRAEKKSAALLSAAVSLAWALSTAGGVHAAADRPAQTQPATGPSYQAPPGALVTQDGWFPPRQPQKPPPALPAEVTRAFVIPIREQISSKTYESIRRKALGIKGKEGKGAQLVIFDIDTPGGRSDAMEDIIRVITDDLADIYTIAYVNPKAMSAGAIIALACSEIVMVPAGRIGDAMPILIGPGGQLMPLPAEEREKVEANARAEARALAQRNGYSDALCQAMISIKLEVWLIRNQDTGELRVVDGEDWRGKVLNAPPASQPAEAPATPAVQGQWEFVARLDKPHTLLTLTTAEAQRASLVRNVFADLQELYLHYNVIAKPAVLTDTWSERLVGFLTSPAVQSLLIFAAIFSLWQAIQAGGASPWTLVAVVCFGVLFGSKYLIGMANWWEIALFVVGIILILLEIFVIPGFGVAGVLGILFCLVSLGAMLVYNPPGELPIPKTSLDWDVFAKGVFATGLGVVLAVVAAVMLGQHLHQIPLAKKLVLAPAETIAEEPAAAEAPIRHVSVGDVGMVQTVCRPVGKVLFGEVLVDALSEDQMIEPGQSVRVIRREGNRLVVERIERQS